MLVESTAFVRDRVTKKTERASVGSGGLEANGSSSVGSVSAGGRFVTFSSTGSNLVPGDTNDVEDTFLRDRLLGMTVPASDEDGSTRFAALSGNIPDMTYEQAQARLLAIARRNGGLIVAADVEADPNLAADRDIVSAAAHSLAASTNVFASAAQAGDWFPYAEIRFSELR